MKPKAILQVENRNETGYYESDVYYLRVAHDSTSIGGDIDVYSGKKSSSTLVARLVRGQSWEIKAPVLTHVRLFFQFDSSLTGQILTVTSVEV